MGRGCDWDGDGERRRVSLLSGGGYQELDTSRLSVISHRCDLK